MRGTFTDSQRSKLYAAEREAFDNTDLGVPYITPDEALELTAKVWASAPGLLGSTPGVRFSRKKNFGAAHYSPWCHRITFHPDSIRAWVVVHEVAHAVEREGAPHGPEFARAYLDLVERTFGWAWRQQLGACFQKHRVRSHGASKRLKPGTGPKRETKRAKADRLIAAAGLFLHADEWNRHWYDVCDKSGKNVWSSRGLDGIIRFVEKRAAA